MFAQEAKCSHNSAAHHPIFSDGLLWLYGMTEMARPNGVLSAKLTQELLQQPPAARLSIFRSLITLLQVQPDIALPQNEAAYLGKNHVFDMLHKYVDDLSQAMPQDIAQYSVVWFKGYFGCQVVPHFLVAAVSLWGHG